MPPQSKTADPKKAARRSWRVNGRAVAALAAAAAVIAALVAASWAIQGGRGRSGLLAEARKLAAQGKKDDLALSFLRQYLADRPRDLDALDLRGEIGRRSAGSVDHFNEVIKNDEAFLRLDTDLASERNQKVRRRLIGTILAVGPMVGQGDRRYGSAETMARELAAQTKTAQDIRLHGRTLAILGVLGDRPKLADAAKVYEQARAMDPKDVPSAEQLARLYQFEIKDQDAADRTIDGLIKATPEAPAYLAAARFAALRGSEAASRGRIDEADADRRRADAMIKKAVAAAPKDAETRFAAADLAIAAKRPSEASAHLDQVPEKERSGHRYLMLRGIVDLYENKSADAIEAWTRGLQVTGGTEVDLTWRLAYVLLQLGRIDEAEPLISQFRRLSGSEEPTPQARYLAALRLIKLNQPVAAIEELEKARLSVSGPLKPQFHYTLGQAREATRDEAGAMEEYGLALAADSRLSAPRLARARLFQGRGKIDEAADEIRRGLEANGDDVALIVAQARLELARQARLPKDRRDWKPLEALLKHGNSVAPANPTLAVVGSSLLTAQGQPEAAGDFLERAAAIDKTDPELWAALAERLAAMGRIDRALATLEHAMEPTAAGDQASLRILRAKYLTAQGHGTEAREGLVRDLDRVRPDQRPQLWMALGEFYNAQNDPKSARKAFTAWADLLPDDPLPALYVLEIALADPSGADPEVVARCLKALAKVGGVYDRIGRAMALLRDPSRPGAPEAPKDRERRLNEAETLVKQAEGLAPTQRFPHILRGALEQQRNNLDLAVAAYERALKAENGLAVLPRLVALYGGMGKPGEVALARLRLAYPAAASGIARIGAEAAARKGDKEEAEALARQVVEGTPESLDARVWQARLLNTLGKPEEAEKALRSLVEAQPEAVGPRLALMYFQVGRGDKKAATATVEEMIQKSKPEERPELIWAQAWRVVDDRDRADKAFEAALARWRDDPRVNRAAIDYYQSTGRLAKAEEVLKELLRRDDTQRWAARGLALLISARPTTRPGDVSAWRQAWEMVKDPAPGGDLPEDRLARALILARGPQAAHRDEAVAMLKALDKDLPADLPAAVTSRRVLAGLLLKSRPDQAAEFAAAEAQASSATAAAISLHATALIAAKKFDDADRQVARLSAVAPDDASTVTLRARLLRARGQGTDAAAALERSAPEKIAGPDGQAVGKLIVQTLLNELEDQPAAERVATLLAEKFPKARGLLATVEALRGARDKALQTYLGVIADGDPVSVRVAARDALTMISRDKFDPRTILMAEQVIDAARKKDDKSTDLLAMAGYLRHYQNRYEEEVKIYADALADHPEDSTILNNYAWTLSEGLHKPDEALERINDAIRRTSPVPPHFYDTRGCIYTRMGRLDDAIADLELSARDRPSATTYAHLARAYHKAKMMDKFRKARDQAKAADPPLTPDSLEKAERDELEPLLFGKE